MYLDELRKEAIELFNKDIPELKKVKEEAYKRRTQFVNYFTVDKLKNLKVEEYALGLNNTSMNFCNFLENNLDELGKFDGAYSTKFSFYFGKHGNKTNQYHYFKQVGNDPETAVKTMAQRILELIALGKKQDTDGLVKNLISPMFKGKILATYFPNTYLNIFSKKHLEFLLNKIEAFPPKFFKQDEVILREKLVSYKNEDEIMKHWDMDMYSTFLYRYYGYPPKNKTQLNTDADIENGNIIFPINQIPVEITQVITETANSTPSTSKKKGKKTDYTKKSRVDSIIGKRGEEMVKQFEVNRLSKYFDVNWLEKNIKIVSKKDDTLGYDVKSFNEDKSERFIEVKTTRNKETYTSFFISANERKFAENEPNFYLYLVYDIISEKPKVWVTGNPFKPLNTKISIEPSAYKVKINTL